MPVLQPRKSPSSAGTSGLVLVAVALGGALVGIALHDHRWHLPAIAPAGPAELQQAQRAFRIGDNQAALSLFTKLADQNSAAAQYWLGHMTELGLGVQRDPSKAIDLYKKAAAQNFVAAELHLGEMYLHGDVVPPDFSQAKDYLERAAYQGNARAATLLGQMYGMGLGTAPDQARAYAWAEVAALEGDTFARHERDASLKDLSVADQKQATARAHQILGEIKRESKPQGATASASAAPSGNAATTTDGSGHTDTPSQRKGSEPSTPQSKAQPEAQAANGR